MIGCLSDCVRNNVDFILRTTPTFIKIPPPEHNYNNHHIYKIPKMYDFYRANDFNLISNNSK